MKYWLSACPRCEADLCEEAEGAGGRGRRLRCVHCGYVLMPSEEAEVTEAMGYQVAEIIVHGRGASRSIDEETAEEVIV